MNISTLLFPFFSFHAVEDDVDEEEEVEVCSFGGGADIIVAEDCGGYTMYGLPELLRDSPPPPPPEVLLTIEGEQDPKKFKDKLNIM